MEKSCARSPARQKLPAPAALTRFFSDGEVAPRVRLHARAAGARPQGQGPGHRDRAASDHRCRGRLAGRSHRAQPSCAAAGRANWRAARDRHTRRPGDARSVQQPVHVDRRADGRRAAEHRLFGQHQGAARFLLRDVRRQRLARRQCARTCRCISARWTTRSRPSSARTRHDPPGRCLRHQRALQRRHASARHHRVHAGVRRSQDPVLGRIARPSRRCRRRLAGLDVAERDDHRAGRRLHGQLQAGRARRASARRSCTTRCCARDLPRATRCRTSTTSRRRSPPTRRACRSCARWCAHFTLPVVKAYMRHVQDNAAESVRRVIDQLHDSTFSYEMDQGTIIKVRITVDKRSARRRSTSPARARSSRPISTRPSR